MDRDGLRFNKPARRDPQIDHHVVGFAGHETDFGVVDGEPARRGLGQHAEGINNGRVVADAHLQRDGYVRLKHCLRLLQVHSWGLGTVLVDNGNGS